MWADVITDAFQFALMCITLAIALPFALKLVGGFEWMVSHMDPQYFSPAGKLPLAYLLALAMTALSVFVEPAFYQRIFSAQDERSVRRALLTGILFWAAYDWTVTVLGIAAAAAVKQHILSPDLEAREALIRIVLISLPIGLKGLFIAGILAAAMSTVDSYLLLSSGNVVYDIYRPLFHPEISETSLLRLTRLGIPLALLACMIIAYYFERLTDAWVFMSTILTATAFIPLMAALFLTGKRKPWEGTLAALFGLVTVLLYYAVVTLFGHPEKQSYVLTVSAFSRVWEVWREYALFFALPASGAGFVLGSIFAPARREGG